MTFSCDLEVLIAEFSRLLSLDDSLTLPTRLKDSLEMGFEYEGMLDLLFDGAPSLLKLSVPFRCRDGDSIGGSSRFYLSMLLKLLLAALSELCIAEP